MKKMKAAIERYLKLRNYDIIDSDVADDVIAAYDLVTDQVVIIKWGVSDEDFEVTPLSNKEFEKTAMSFLKDHDDYVDVTIRHDVVDLHVIKSTRGLIRHHVNVFGGGDNVDF